MPRWPRRAHRLYLAAPHACLPSGRATHILAVWPRRAHACRLAALHSTCLLAAPFVVCPRGLRSLTPWLRRSHCCRHGCAGHTVAVMAAPETSSPSGWPGRLLTLGPAPRSCRLAAPHCSNIVVALRFVLTAGRAAPTLAIRSLSAVGHRRHLPLPPFAHTLVCSLDELPKALTLSSAT